MDLTEKEIDQLRRLEESLWIASTRFDRDYMEQVLHLDFFEFGRSGKLYTRDQCMEFKTHEIRAKFPLEDFAVHLIIDNAVMVTYLSEVQYDKVERANRSSVWVRTPGGWQLRFHQGTPV